MTINIPQDLGQQADVQALGHAIARQLHGEGITVEDRNFETVAAVIAVGVGVPAEVAVFVAIDASIWSTHVLDSIDLELKGGADGPHD